MSVVNRRSTKLFASREDSGLQGEGQGTASEKMMQKA